MALQIPDSLARFRDESALIIVSGGKAAKIYAVLNGAIDEVADIPAAEIHYSDKEEYWATRSGGRFLGSGATGNSLDDEEKVKFRNNIASVLEKIWSPAYVNVYILASDWDRQSVVDALPPQAKKVIFGKSGNFVRKPPVQILEIIAKRK